MRYIEVFSRLGTILFEPLAVTAGLGLLVLAVELYRTGHRREFWFGIAGLLFLIGWRSVVEIQSSRYASLLIFPGLLMIAAFCYWRRFPLCFSRGVLTGLVIVAVVKDLRFNRYDDFIPFCSRMIQADATQYHAPLVLDFCGEGARLKHYTRMNVIPELGSGSSVVDLSVIRDELPLFRYSGDAVYVVCNRRAGQEKIEAQEVGCSKTSWKLIASRFRNNRRKLAVCVYRYLPPGFSALPKLFSAESPIVDGLVPNGNFEIEALKETPHMQKTLDFLQRKGLKFFESPGVRLPAEWSLHDTGGYETASAAQVELCDKEPLSGSLSLRLFSRQLIAVRNLQFYPSGNWRLKFLVRGKPGTLFNISLHLYDAANRWKELRLLQKYKLSSDFPAQYELPVTMENFMPFPKARLCFQLQFGELWLDDVSIIFSK